MSQQSFLLNTALLCFGSLLFLTACANLKVDASQASSIQFLDEFIIDNQPANYTDFGGISGIDKVNDSTYILVSDDQTEPRLYRLEIHINNNKFSQVKLSAKQKLVVNSNYTYDSESLRYNKKDQTYWISSEGNIKANQSGFIAKISNKNKVEQHITFKKPYQTNNSRHNGSFESLDVDSTGFWFASELPLINDGKAPGIIKRSSPIRLAHYNLKEKQVNKAFAVNLQKINKIPLLPFATSGLTEILQLNATQFLGLERAYSAGHKSKGNNVYLWLIDIKDATNVSKINSIKAKKNKIAFAKKTLLFNFKSIKKHLTQSTLDNLEGLCFGPRLTNGKQSILVISDNNFNNFAPQLNQLILLELNL